MESFEEYMRNNTPNYIYKCTFAHKYGKKHQMPRHRQAWKAYIQCAHKIKDTIIDKLC